MNNVRKKLRCSHFNIIQRHSANLFNTMPFGSECTCIICLSIYIYIYICVCVTVYIYIESRGNASEKGGQDGQEARGRIAMVLWPCGRVLWPELCRRKAGCKRTQAKWQLAVQEGKQIEGLELVSCRFQKVTFGSLGCWPHARRSKQVGSWQCRTGLELFLVSSDSDVWQSGLLAAGPIGPSLPCCFSPATRSLDPSCARRKLVGKRSKCKTKASCKTQQASWKLAVQNGRQRQGLELVSSQFRKWRLAVWAAGRESHPSFTTIVF